MSSPVNGGATNAPPEPADHDQPEDDVAQAMVEQETQPRSGEALEPADHPHQRGDEALLSVARELEPAPALRQPDLIAPGDQLEREQDRR